MIFIAKPALDEDMVQLFDHVIPRALTAKGERTLVGEYLRAMGVCGRLGHEMPVSGATGDWPKRMGAQENDRLAGLQLVNRRVFRRLLRNGERAGCTPGTGAARIAAEKHSPRHPKRARAVTCR